MTKKSRYGLIAAGFIAFFILAPLIVLYVRGISYNFQTKTFVTTGILAVQVQPKNARIYVDGKVKRSGSGDIKFIIPGQYQVTAKAPGYSDWSKRLEVDEGQVTWASPPYNDIYLFLQNPVQRRLASGVLDFYDSGNKIFYLSSNTFTASSTDGSVKAQVLQLPKSVDTILANDASGANFVLANSTADNSPPTILAVNLAAGKIFDISSLFNSQPQIQFSDSGDLYALADGTLYKVAQAALTKTPVLKSVKAFYLQANDLYTVQATGQIYSLLVTNLPSGTSQQLLSDVPPFGSGQLLVTFGKQIFLLADGNLYLANSSMEEIANNVSAWDLDQQNSYLAILHSGELDYYDATGGNLNFITRSSLQTTGPSVRGSIGYAFFSAQNQINSIELDTRDNQNQYTLYKGTDLEKFTVDEAGKNILVLDNGSLKSLVIR